jgi:hypothetical protein
MEMLEAILALVAGLVLVFAGKRFFWLAAGLAAFLFTWVVFETLFGGGWLAILTGLVVACVLGWLATKFIKWVGLFIGFAAGAVIFPFLLGLIGVDLNWLIGALVGGVIGLILMHFLFDWGLIVLTALMGSSVVSNRLEGNFGLGASLAGLIGLVLLVAGVIVQARAKD